MTRKHPYQCYKRIPGSGGKRCWKRLSLPPGTQDNTTKCPKCGQWSMVLVKHRLAARTDPEKAKTDSGEPCLCNGVKPKKMDKYIDDHGVTLIVGPHRKGQFGCKHHPDYGKTDQELSEP